MLNSLNYDNLLHLDSEGAKLRTMQLVKDLEGWVSSDGQPDEPEN